MNYPPSYEDVHGQGPGDPDVHGHFPGDPDERNCLICTPSKAKVPSVYAKKHWSQSPKPFITRSYEPYEYADNDPASPEQAGY